MPGRSPHPDADSSERARRPNPHRRPARSWCPRRSSSAPGAGGPRGTIRPARRQAHPSRTRWRCPAPPWRARARRPPRPPRRSPSRPRPPERRDQHRTTPELVTQRSDRQKGYDQSGHVHGEDHRQHRHRQAPPLQVQGVDRRGRTRRCHQQHVGEDEHPKTGAASQATPAREGLCTVHRAIPDDCSAQLGQAEPSMRSTVVTRS